MNRKLSQLLGLSALAISLATLPSVLSASAQTTTTPDGTATSTSTDRPVTDGNYQDSDWGLLGLLGLFGLFGRRNRKHNEETVGYTNRDVVGTSSDRTRY
ncbi:MULTISPECIES: WGxxGxxG family protein [Nostocales]|uniref:WGxxGxxG-CTERM domain-containing protein n=3 Tax=Nostocales TaxID=1161 RepID=A0A0C1RM70_9CYAN|nr:WGxxGxxG family protein [Tolypothrix bouteillei]KAF3887997.1 WGxxGxxG-CTERM domain-containing protein [Tolypothrix bouteillei VB521301]